MTRTVQASSRRSLSRQSHLRNLLASLFVLLSVTTVRADEKICDVVVYGGTSAGVVASVQVARMGKSVILIEPGKHLGGLTAGGLGWTDSGNKAVIGGVSREFYQLIKRHYDQPSAWKFQNREKYARYRPKDDAMWTFAPHVAESVFEDLIAAAKVLVIRNQRLEQLKGVRMQGQRIRSITMENGESYRGKMFIDATYEGDLMAAAGVTFTVGREANSKYDETLNGVQKRQNTHSHRFRVPVDPYIVPGDPKSGLVKGVHDHPLGPDGQGDRKVQAYCFRMCMSNVPENRVPFPKPAGYDESDYELLFRNYAAGDLRLPMKPDMMPNGKTDTNNNCAFSTDNIGMNYDYPEANYARRAEILREHESYQKGLMWTLANHPRVPEVIRKQMSQWGLAKDEFQDNGHWPHQLYIREARRMVSDYVLTEHDCRRIRIVKDSIGLGSYNMDSHNIQRYVTEDGHVQNEGDVQVSPGGPYLVSYRSIVPKRGEAQNLLVPVCISSSHIAYGSVRMEPVFMILGQSAATAAVLAVANNVHVQDVKYQELRKRLLADNQALDLPPQIAARRVIAARQLDGIVVDDSKAHFVGTWTRSASASPFVDYGYRHDSNEGKGKKSVRFETKLKPGRYEVRVSYSPHANRAKKVSIEIKHSDGVATVDVDQTKKPKIDGLFISLGRFQFDSTAAVLISNRGTQGYVIADAVQFIRVPTGR